MIRPIFCVTCFVLLVSAQVPSMTHWRGLSPLKSTRMDVERTLGLPERKIDNRQHQMTYYLPDVTVFVYFFSNPKCEQKLPYTSWDVPSDTVTAIDISLKRPPSVAETGIDLTKFKKIEGSSDMVDRYFYLNADDGFSIEVGGNNNVTNYHYRPGSKQQKLRCEPGDQP
jgi:hypothetical protein